MPLFKLSPLKSRLAASITALIVLLLLYYFVVISPNLAYAIHDSEALESPHNQNHERILYGTLLNMLMEEQEGEENEVKNYEANLFPIDGGIIERQVSEIMVLNNNVVVPVNIEKGHLLSFVFRNTSLWEAKSPTSSLPPQVDLSAKQDFHRSEDLLEETSDTQLNVVARDKKTPVKQRRLFVTVTTCLQPNPVSKSITKPPPQLQLYVSQLPKNKYPGPSQDSQSQVMKQLDGGYVLYTVNATDDVYIGVYAMDDINYSGIYSAEVAASIDAPFHFYENTSDPNLFVADSDGDAVLLYTDPFVRDGSNATLLQQWENAAPPFVMFASDTDVNLTGLQYSYCGLEHSANIASPSDFTIGVKSNVATGITTVGDPKLPRQQFYMEGLKSGTTYTVILAIASDTTKGSLVGGGGRVFHQTSFSTLADGNCDLIYGLSFCDQVAYSVPSNPNNFSSTSLLAAFYDNSTRAIYANFEKVLAQIPCNITSSGQYSLVRTCDDCAQAYKAWLCAVNIPRCTDVNSRLTWLQPRALDQPYPNGTSLDSSFKSNDRGLAAVTYSRNTIIDQIVSPGPYKEVLPCQELCHRLVSSCPAALGFNCPRPGQIGFNTSYGQRPVGWTDDHGRNTNITCNFPGIFYFSHADINVPPLVVIISTAVLVSTVMTA